MATKPAARSARNGWRATLQPGDIYQWQITLPLPLLARPFIHVRFLDGDVRRRVPGGRPRRKRRKSLDELGGDGSGVSAIQAIAIDHLAANEAAIVAKSLHALAAYEASVRGRPASQRLTAKQVVQQVLFTHACVIYKPKRGIASLELAGECAWDREHGFYVVFDRLRVVSVCQQGTGWIDKKSN